MKYRSAFLSACFVLAGIALAYAADFNGKWIAQVPGRDGQTRETTFNFKVEENKLTGTVSGRQGDNPISDGKITADEISFTVTANFGGNEIKLLFKGKVVGDEIKFTRIREGGDQPAQEFTAKKVKYEMGGLSGTSITRPSAQLFVNQTLVSLNCKLL